MKGKKVVWSEPLLKCLIKPASDSALQHEVITALCELLQGFYLHHLAINHSLPTLSLPLSSLLLVLPRNSPQVSVWPLY